MADLDAQLLASLFSNGINGTGTNDIGNFEKTIAANDLYKLAAQPVLGAKFNTATWSPGETIGVSAGQAFLGALLNGLGQRSEAEQMAKVAQVLPDLYSNPSAVMMPDGVDPEAFGALKLSALTNRSRNSAEQTAKIMQDLFGVKIEGMKAKEKAKGEIAGQNEAYGTEGATNPNDPRVKGADELRKELLGNKEIADFQEVKNKLQVLQKAATDPRSVSDLDFIYGVSKILDPGSVVRQSDAGMVIESNSIPASTLGYLNKYIGGGATLDASQRQALIDLAARHYETRKERISSINDNYTKLAKTRGINPEDLNLPNIELPQVQTISPKETVYPSQGDNNKPNIDIGLLKQEALALRSQGMTPSEIAATLRNKYGGQ